MNKDIILQHFNFETFYKGYIPSLRLNGNKQAMGLCPFHDDKTPSLSVNISTGFYKCFACNESGDVFTFYQKLKNVDFKTALKEIGEMIGAIEQKRIVVATFHYMDIKGNILYIKERIEPGRNGRKKEFIFKHKKNKQWVTGRGNMPVLYNLPELAVAEYAVIVEGEAKADLLIKWDIVATCLDSGAQSPWKDQYLRFLEGKKIVAILPDNDEPGRLYASRIANALYGKVRQLKVVELPGLQAGEDIIDWAKKEGNTKENLLKLIRTSPDWIPQEKVETTKDDEWHDPVALEYYSNLSEFPVKCLPSPGQQMVQAITEVNQVDTGLPGSIYLAVLSTCLSKKVEVDLITHREPVNLYICSILGSGERKTSSVNLLTTPLYEYQLEKAEEMKTKIAEAVSRRKIEEARLVRLQKDAASASQYDFKAQNDAMELANEIEENPIPKTPVYIADDITSEALGALMAENLERLSIISTEGGIFGIMAGRYQEKQDGNFDIYLKAHAGDPWSSHRIGREAKSVLSPSLTMGLAVQHDVLKEIGKNKRFRGRGLLARFLYSLCSSRVGIRKRHNRMIPGSLLQQYSNHIKELMNIQLERKTLKLSPGAQGLWDKLYNDTESEMKNGNSLEAIKDWGSKLPGAVARIAGLLHVAEYGVYASDESISIDTVNASIAIGLYFREHALSAFGLMQEDARFEGAKKILDFIVNRKLESFKGRDILNGIYSFKDMGQVNSGLNILLEREYIREMQKTSSKDRKKGRPEATSYKVNPRLYKNHLQK